MHVEAVGPFVFLDHAAPIEHAPDEPRHKVGNLAHPHRGIATLTYILNGEADHYDSKGHHAIVRSGGVQWMKAGKGIIHDEVVNPDPQTNDRLTHALQFWIDLPSRIKAEQPEYLPLQANEIPKKVLAGNVGWLKVIVGRYEDLASAIPNYSKQLIYHIHLEAGMQFALGTEKELEYAIFLPLSSVTINEKEFKRGEFIGFEKSDGIIELNNSSVTPADIILFGGEPYAEPIVARGPFVMNTLQEISQAYTDFHLGKYGQITYE